MTLDTEKSGLGTDAGSRQVDLLGVTGEDIPSKQSGHQVLSLKVQCILKVAKLH